MTCGASAIFGDFPFMVSGHSADVWARQDEFRLDASVGVPPDAFSETGQDWGLAGLSVGRHRRDRLRVAAAARRAAPPSSSTAFASITSSASTAPSSASATAARLSCRRRRRRSARRASDSAICSRQAGRRHHRRGPRHRSGLRARVACPAAGAGLKVLRWEREWDEPEQPFRDPVDYPRASVATTGTHDTETLAEWWDAADRRGAPALRRCPDDCERPACRRTPFSPVVRDALIRAMFAAAIAAVAVPSAGHLRLARSHQYSRRRDRWQLDLAVAMAGRRSADASRRRVERADIPACGAHAKLTGARSPF